jgi:precorrin-2 dehydrogenase/sirohydrochlorin ferrochelatase
MSIANSALIIYNAFVKTYPICLIDLERRHTVVLGGGAVAARKVGDLLEAGARVTVISPTLTPGLKALAKSGQIAIIGRPYREGDLSNAFLVIAATDDADVNQKAWQEAERCGCLANVVDDPTHSHFISPAVIRRGDVSITVSTGGTSPALARRLREHLETLVGPEYGALAELMAELRPELRLRYEREEDRQRAAFRLVDSDLMNVIKTQGMRKAKMRAWQILVEDSK